MISDVLPVASSQQKACCEYCLTWTLVPRLVREMSGNFRVSGEWSPCIPEVSGGTQKTCAVRGYTQASFLPNFLIGFCSDRPCECSSQFWIRRFTCAWDNWRYPKNLGSSRICPGSFFTEISNGLFVQMYLGPPAKFEVHIALPIPEILRLKFWVGVANPQSWGRGCLKGSEMVPFERALVSFCFYKPSIVNFPRSLRVSEILPLSYSSTPLFPTNFSMFPCE